MIFGGFWKINVCCIFLFKTSKYAIWKKKNFKSKKHFFLKKNCFN